MHVDVLMGWESEWVSEWSLVLWPDLFYGFQTEQQMAPWQKNLPSGTDTDQSHSPSPPWKQKQHKRALFEKWTRFQQRDTRRGKKQCKTPERRKLLLTWQSLQQWLWAALLVNEDIVLLVVSVSQSFTGHRLVRVFVIPEHKKSTHFI